MFRSKVFQSVGKFDTEVVLASGSEGWMDSQYASSIQGDFENLLLGKRKWQISCKTTLFKIPFRESNFGFWKKKRLD